MKYKRGIYEITVCGARYKTRPGLTYHYGHSHRDGASDENSRESAPSSCAGAGGGQTGVSATVGGAPVSVGGATVPMGVSFAGQPVAAAGGMGGGGILSDAAAQIPGGPVYQDSYVTFLNHPAGTAYFFFTLFFYSVFVVCLHVNELITDSLEHFVIACIRFDGIEK